MSVLLKKWHPLFDASRERVDVVPTWVRLPSLPLSFWFEEYFEHIGNLLGSFLEADYSFKVTNLKRVAWILVNIKRLWTMKTYLFAAEDAMCMGTQRWTVHWWHTL